MLNCVMYRIIERGGNRIGPRRAFLYAKEFERNIDYLINDLAEDLIDQNEQYLDNTVVKEAKKRIKEESTNEKKSKTRKVSTK